MTVVGTAEITIVADDAAFASQLEAQSSAGLDGLAADAGVAGQDAGDALREGMAPGLAGAGEDAEKASGSIGDDLATGLGAAGTKGGEDARAGLKTGLDDAAEDAETSGGTIGGKLSGALSNALGGITGLFGKTGEDAGEEMGDKLTSSASTGLGKLSSLFEGIGGEIGPLGSAVDSLGEKLEGAGGKGSGLVGTLTSIGGGVALGAAAGLAVFSVASIKMASDFDSTVTSIAANANISTTAAQKIGQAFLSTAGSSVYSGQQIATAYSGVAGQLGSLQGKALTAAQALDVMKTAGDLAEGTGTDLNSATKALVTTMQGYQLTASQSGMAADVLTSASRDTGTSVGQLSTQLAKLHTTLGDNAPSLQQTAGLLLDLKSNGETGRQAMSSLSEMMQDLITPTAAQGKAMQALGISVTDANGNFIGIGPALDELSNKLMNGTNAQDQQAAASIFGAKAASQLMETISGGSQEFDKYTGEASKAGSAQEAAEKQSQTLAHQFDILKSSVSDAAVQWGNVLIPILEKVANALLKVGNYVIDHKALLITLAAVIGGPLVVAFGLWAASMIAAALPLLAITADLLLLAAPIVGIGLAIDYLATHWSQVWGDIKKWFDDAVSFLRSGFGTLAIMITGPIAPLLLLALHWQQVWSTLKSVGQAAWDGIQSDLIHPLENAWSAVEGAWTTMVTFFTGLPGKIISVLSSFGSMLLTWIDTAWNKVYTEAQNLVNTYISFWTTIPQRIINALLNWGSLLIGWLQTAWNKLTTEALSLFSTWLGWWTSLPQLVINALAALGADLVTWIGEAFDKLKAGAVSAWGTVVGWFSTIPGLIIAAVGSLLTTLASAGGDVISGLWNGAKAGWTALGNIGTTIKGWFTSALSDADKWLLDVGKAIIQGLANGITDAESKVTSALSSVVNDIKKIPVIGGLFGSPSPYFTEVGDDGIGQGLANGITAGSQTKVLPAATALNNQIKQALGSMGLTGSSSGAGGNFGWNGGSRPSTAPTIQVTVAANAVQINVPDGATAGAAQDIITQGFTTLGREIQSGVAPLRTANT